MKKSLVISICLFGYALFGAPSAPDIVAEGFPAYEGVAQANHVFGRRIVPSDLRQRAVLIVQCDTSKLQAQLLETAPLQGIDGFSGGEIQWDSAEYPRTGITVVSLLGDKIDAQTFGAAFSSKNADEEKQKSQNQALSYWRSLGKAYYHDIRPAGEPDNLAETPYVYVFDGKNKEPLFKGKYSKKELAKIKNAMTKAMLANKEWTPLTGVAEVKHMTKFDKIIKEGKKPLKQCIDQLKPFLKDKDTEKAKEAQIMYDALNQYRDDLVNRIEMECSHAPARAYVDAMTLFKYFPQEKKSLQAVMQRLKGSTEIMAIGKCMVKFLEWSDPNYICKNAAEAKKNVATISGWKKTLEKLQTNPNAQISGEAALINSQLDALIEAMPSKVPQK